MPKPRGSAKIPAGRPGRPKRQKTEPSSSESVHGQSQSPSQGQNEPSNTIDNHAKEVRSQAKSAQPESNSTSAISEKAQNDDDDDDYDENEDDDYDPSRKPEVQEDESDGSEDENQPDYSAISTEVSQVRTRGQRYKDTVESASAKSAQNGLVQDTSRVNIDEIFQSLQQKSADDWASMVRTEDPANETSDKTKEDQGKTKDSHPEDGAEKQITIYSTYTFAGKLVREAKTVSANSAEAKAYLNSTKSLTSQEETSGPRKSYVMVTRKVAGTEKERQLRIKLRRPSLIDKFLLGDKQNKLTTLEKSRLDWASFVDKKKLKDDLAIHNKGGYLEKQDFLGRMEAKRDTQYKEARELDRQRQWQQQQSQKS